MLMKYHACCQTIGRDLHLHVATDMSEKQPPGSVINTMCMGVTPHGCCASSRIDLTLNAIPHRYSTFPGLVAVRFAYTLHGWQQEYTRRACRLMQDPIHVRGVLELEEVLRSLRDDG